MKTILLLFLILASGIAQADELKLLIPMKYPTILTTRADRTGAFSLYRNGNPQVLVTPNYLGKWPREAVNAVVMHEYCHLDLRHSQQEDQSPVIAELEADCCAAQELSKLDLTAVLEDIKFYYYMQDTSPQCEYLVSVGPSGHLNGHARVETYNYCQKHPQANTEELVEHLEDYFDTSLPL